MAEIHYGGFEYCGHTYHFIVADCCWSEGNLEIVACGDDCDLFLAAILFPGVSELADLPGRAWELDEEQSPVHSDHLEGSGVEVGGKELHIVKTYVECRRFDAAQCALTVNFRLTVHDDEFDREDEVEGWTRCKVLKRDKTHD